MGLYAITLADGSVAIMQTVDQPTFDDNGHPIVGDGGAIVMRETTPDECFAKWPMEEQARLVAHQRIDAAALPADRTFRDAWKVDGGAIVHDMDRARGIHRDRMRAARAPRLTALDVAYQRADERGDGAAKSDVAARKQALRDVTADPAIAAAETPDALKAVWPEILQD